MWRSGVQEGIGIEDCVVSVDKVCVCHVNSRGVHVAGDRKCPVRERETQVEVARVRVVQKVSYAEGVKKGVRDPGRMPVNSRSVPAQRDRPMSDTLYIQKYVDTPSNWWIRLFQPHLLLKGV